MQHILIIAASLDALTPHLGLGRWTHVQRGGHVFALCEPHRLTARHALQRDVALHVLPAPHNAVPLPTALVTAMAKHGATTTDTARTFLARLHTSGIHIFDPDL